MPNCFTPLSIAIAWLEIRRQSHIIRHRTSPPGDYDIGQEMSAEDYPVEGNEEQDRNCDHSCDGSPLQGSEDDQRQGCGGYRGLARGKGATVPASRRILPYGRKIGGSAEFDDFTRASSSNGVLQKLYCDERAD